MPLVAHEAPEMLPGQAGNGLGESFPQDQEPRLGSWSELDCFVTAKEGPDI